MNNMSDLGSQLFHGLTAMNLQTAKSLRPLSDSEKELLAECKTKAGDMLPRMEHFKEQNPIK